MMSVFLIAAISPWVESGISFGFDLMANLESFEPGGDTVWLGFQRKCVDKNRLEWREGRGRGTDRRALYYPGEK